MVATARSVLPLGWIAVVTIGATAASGALGVLVASHVYDALATIGNGGDPYTPQPLAVLFACGAAVGAFLGVLLGSLALAASGMVLLTRRRTRHNQREVPLLRSLSG
jgi:hypothetical protein